MEDNNLEARNRYVEKVLKRVNKLSQSINLLKQIDEQMFNHSIFQNHSMYGGGLRELGVNISAVSARASSLKSTIDSADALAKRLGTLDTEIKSYQDKLSAILNQLNVNLPTFDAELLHILTDQELIELENFFIAVIKAESDTTITTANLDTTISTTFTSFKNEINKRDSNPGSKAQLNPQSKTKILVVIHERLKDLSNKYTSLHTADKPGWLTF